MCFFIHFVVSVMSHVDSSCPHRFLFKCNEFLAASNITNIYLCLWSSFEPYLPWYSCFHCRWCTILIVVIELFFQTIHTNTHTFRIYYIWIEGCQKRLLLSWKWEHLTEKLRICHNQSSTQGRWRKIAIRCGTVNNIYVYFAKNVIINGWWLWCPYFEENRPAK